MKSKSKSNILILSLLLSILPISICLGVTTDNLGKTAENIIGSLTGVTSLIVSISVVAGLGFGVASIFKFKQHKDNPTQVPLGQPLSLLAIAVMLIWIQYLLQASGQTITGDKAADNDAQSKVGKQAPGWLKQ